MKIKIEIDTSNAAFDNNAAEYFRVAESAIFAALRLEESSALDSESVLFDSNGNRCGFIRLEQEISQAEMIRRNSELARAIDKSRGRS